MADDPTTQWIQGILSQNSNLNFVQRIQQPDKWPILPMGKQGYATHLMAWASDDKGPFVYATVVYDPTTKKLHQLDPRSAVAYAQDSGEMIRFKTDAEADRFSKEYKRVWNH